MPHPAIFFEIVGTDGDDLRDFYGQLFGWTIEKSELMDCGMVSPEDGGIEGGIGVAAGGGDGHTLFYVRTDNPQETLDRAEVLDGRTVQPPIQLPRGGVIAVMADREGHAVGLYRPAAE